MDTLERILVEQAFFRELEPEYVKLLASCATNARFHAGAYLFRQGEEANHFYLVRRGKVALEIFAPQHPPIVIATLEEGDIMGWSWLVPPYYWRLDARAVQQTHVLALDGKCLRSKCEENHDLGYELLKRFTQVIEQRLHATRMQLLDVYAVNR